MNNNLAETYETQNLIIKMQSEVINDLLTVLLQHLAAEDAESLPCIDKINMAAKLRADLQKEP